MSPVFSSFFLFIYLFLFISSLAVYIIEAFKKKQKKTKPKPTILPPLRTLREFTFLDVSTIATTIASTISTIPDVANNYYFGHNLHLLLFWTLTFSTILNVVSIFYNSGHYQHLLQFWTSWAPFTIVDVMSIFYYSKCHEHLPPFWMLPASSTILDVSVVIVQLLFSWCPELQPHLQYWHGCQGLKILCILYLL